MWVIGLPLAGLVMHLVFRAYLVRARNFDRAIGRYIERYPEATAVNIGAGLDTTFSRADNGKMRWYDLDLPDGIAFRQQFIPETPRNTCIAKSVFDCGWFNEVEFRPERGVFFIAGGIFQYFHESEISGLFDAMAHRFPGGEIIFDAASKLGVKMANRMVEKTGNKGAPMYFGLGNPVRQISKWSDRIADIEWYSFWHDVPRNPKWRKRTIWEMNGCDLFGMGKYVQVRFLP